MGCLYCGKEIGPLRHLRDREFCTDAHRTHYHERLGKALFQMSRPDPAPAPPTAFLRCWPVQTGRTRPSLSGWVEPSGVGLRPITTEFPFSFAAIQANHSVSYSAPAAEVLPAFEAMPVSDPQPFDFDGRGSDNGRAWLPPLPEAGEAVLPLGAALLALAPVSIAAVGSHPTVKLTLIAANRMAHVPAAPRFAGMLERAAAPCLATARPAEYEHPVEERLVEPAVAGCARASSAPQLPRVAAAIATAGVAWPGFRAPLQPGVAEPPARPRAGLEAAGYPRHGTAMPAFRVESGDEGAENAALLERIPPPGRNLLAFPEAEAVERWVAVRGTIEAPLPAAPPVSLPALKLKSVNPLGIERERAEWAEPLEPEGVEIEVHALTKLSHLALPAPVLGLPRVAVAASMATAMPEQENWQAMDEAEPVEMFLRPAMAEALPRQQTALKLPPFVSVPRTIAGQVAPPAASGDRVGMPAAAAAWEAVKAQDAASIAASLAANELKWRTEAHLPGFGLKAAALGPMAGFGAAGPAALRPAEGAAFQPPLEPAATPIPAAPDWRPAPPRAALAVAEPIPLEFFFRAPMGTLRKRVSWIPTVPEPMLPAWSLQPVTDRGREARGDGRNSQAALATVLQMPEVRKRQQKPVPAGAIKALAASLLVGSLLWYGVPQIRQAHRQVLINHGGDSAADSVTVDAEAPSRTGPDSGASGATPPSPGWGQRIRGAIASRATTEITDSFHGSMSAWGTGAKSLATGWSRSPEGFVRPGQLALLSPTLGFSDYRMEFLGEIENKSMDWVVRAADSKNYYAMKFTVIDPGPRPVIAMVHYPVQGGKAGHRVEIPLNVMVHNNTPYRVSVNVSGSRIVTSIEGEEVDSWTDDTLPKGGVGFFADAGERARLYWVKVAHNDDWIGRICAYFAGDGTAASAELWPSSTPSPERPHGPAGAGQEPLVAAAALAFERRRRVRFSRISELEFSEPQHQDHRRFSLCHPS